MLHLLLQIVRGRSSAMRNASEGSVWWYLSREKRLLSPVWKRSLSGYKGDGKTTVSILNQDMPHVLLIDAYSRVGFRLNTGIFIVGPMAIFPRSLLQWDVGSVQEVSENSLSLFYTLEPRLDMLIIGAGEGGSVPMSVLEFMQSKGINVEVLPTYQACSTYNFLVAEDRYVAGALIPPRILPVSVEDIMRTKAQQRQKMYEMEDDWILPNKM